MIGMMNGGNNSVDVPMEFYAGHRPRPQPVNTAETLLTEKAVLTDFYASIPSPLSKSASKEKLGAKKLSYTPDGRMLVDGQPAVVESPEQMWHEVMMRVMAHSLCEKYLKERKRGSRRMRDLFTPGASLRSVLDRHSTKRNSSTTTKNAAAESHVIDNTTTTHTVNKSNNRDKDTSNKVYANNGVGGVVATAATATSSYQKTHHSTDKTHHNGEIRHLAPKFIASIFLTRKSSNNHNETAVVDNNKPLFEYSVSPASMAKTTNATTKVV
jgi:hypothetical protein